MAIVIREADLATELDALRAIYDANRDAPGAPSRFPWLYLENPDGQATAWVAVDDRTGDLAGFTAVFPRRIRVAGHGREVVAWNCGDFSIHKRYRTMGVAVKLRRAARLAVDAGVSPFLYAHPNDRMLAVHQQAGHRQLGRMRRFVKPLSLGSGAVASMTRAALVFAGRDVLIRRSHDVQWIAGCPVPDDVGGIFDEVAPRLGTALVRDRQYLDWRFRRFPLDPTELVIVRRAGRPTAYLAFTVKGLTAYVRDWLALDREAFDQGWAALVDNVRQRAVARVSATALETHPDLPRLRSLGFFEREEVASAVVTYTAPGSGYEAVLDARSWYMTVGDRDV